ncbi:hypothetical protein ACH47X_09335 [Promicromonospora kroppenstedtii]|uniref:Prepilin-type N-terminal cleavage/methylation domain-containing protein n=1 Tax=Promicromonospora kroppenstedtii TaxID=440482 RepID=A0ABW7XIU5_9MICO
MTRRREMRLGWPEWAIVVLLSLVLAGVLGVVLLMQFLPGLGMTNPSDGYNVQFYENLIDKFEYELETRAAQGRLEQSDIDSVFSNTSPVEWGGQFGEGYRIVVHLEAPDGYDPCHTYELSPFGGASPDSLEIPQACRDR